VSPGCRLASSKRPRQAVSAAQGSVATCWSVRKSGTFDRPSWLKTPSFRAEDHRPHRARRFGQCRRVDQRHPRRDVHQLPDGYRDQLRVAAAGEQRAHFVADVPAGNRITECLDGPGDLHAEVGRGAGRWRVVALPLQDVGAIQRRGSDPNQDLTRTCNRIVDLLNFEDVRTAGLSDDDCAHGSTVAGRSWLIAATFAVQLSSGRTKSSSSMSMGSQATSPSVAASSQRSSS